MENKEKYVEQVNRLFKEMMELPEEDRFKEFASLVYGKICVKAIIDICKKHFDSPEQLAEALKTSPVLNEITAAISAYITFGGMLGYAEVKREEDVSK